MMQKIRKKSSSFWKHGRRSNLEFAIMKNKKKKRKSKVDPLDTTKPDWSKR